MRAIRTHVPAVMVWVVLAAGIMPAAGENLLADGGFEGLAPTGMQYAGAYLGNHTYGWYIQSGACYLYWNLTGYLADGQVVQTNVSTTLQQAFATTAGQRYEVSFLATSSEVTAPDKHATAWIDGGDIRGAAPSGLVASFDTGQVGAATQWTWPAEPYRFEFTATGSVSTLSVAGYNRVVLDTFSVQPVPEPASLLLLAGGAVAAARRRRVTGTTGPGR